MQDVERDAVAYAAGIRKALKCSNNATLEGMVHRALGRRSIRRAPIKAEVTTAIVNGETAIYVASRLTAPRSRWVLAHEFATWVMREDGMPADQARALRSSVAAELLLPESLAASVLRTAPAIIVAEEFVLPTAATLLREAEVLGVPTALVVPGRYVRVKGNDAGRLPLEQEALELLASRRGIGVIRFPVPEDGGTVVRLAALLRLCLRSRALGRLAVVALVGGLVRRLDLDLDHGRRLWRGFLLVGGSNLLGALDAPEERSVVVGRLPLREPLFDDVGGVAKDLRGPPGSRFGRGNRRPVSKDEPVERNARELGQAGDDAEVHAHARVFGQATARHVQLRSGVPDLFGQLVFTFLRQRRGFLNPLR